MVINHLLAGMILQVPPTQDAGSWEIKVDRMCVFLNYLLEM